MPRRITIQPHLSLDELEIRYRQSTETSQRTRYQVILLLAQGKSSTEVAALTGYGKPWIYEIVRRYNRLGPEVLSDQRHKNPGIQPLLNEMQEKQLWQALQEAPPDGGSWNGPKVAAWMSQLLGRPVYPQRGWEYLKRWHLRLPVPLPQHPPADPDEQQTWKKKLQKLARMQALYPDAAIEVWVSLASDRTHL